MNTREEVISFCRTFDEVYEDYPFHDENWTLMRCNGNKKMFACIYQHGDYIWINVKVTPEWIDFWRNAWPSVVPAYHMNKNHWNSLILNDVIPEDDIKRMILESYDLVKPKRMKTQKNR